MTKDAKDTLTRWGKVVLLVGGLFGLLAAIEARGDDRFVTRLEYRTDQTADSAWKAEQRAMTLDVLCASAVDPTNRRCRP